MSKVKTGLVLEGGAMRGIFSAGVLDYMLKKDIYYDYVIGVSAGAGNAVNYVSRQEGRTKKIITHENAESYYGVGQLFENKKILNLEMLVAEYALKDIPYDFEQEILADGGEVTHFSHLRQSVKVLLLIARLERLSIKGILRLKMNS